jgi:hypothetical protein
MGPLVLCVDGSGAVRGMARQCGCLVENASYARLSLSVILLRGPSLYRGHSIFDDVLRTGLLFVTLRRIRSRIFVMLVVTIATA